MSDQLELDGAEISTKKNTGIELEQKVHEAAGVFYRAKYLYLEKSDPPVVVLRHGGGQRVVQKRNPFLDYVGVWTELSGRTLIIEAKSTAGHLLPFRRDGGLTERQVLCLSKWHHAKAFVGIVWEWTGVGARWVSYSKIAEAMNNGAKSLVWEEHELIEEQEGYLNFRKAMIRASALKQATKDQLLFGLAPGYTARTK